MSRADDALKDAVLAAMLPAVPFDGWTRGTMRAAAARAGIDPAVLDAIFPNGPRDAVAWFSHWADRETLAAMAARRSARMRTGERVAEGVRARLAILLPHREAARRGLALLAMPPNLALAARLLYDTVDAIWHAAGDTATDFNFYSKRGLLAGVYAATTLYWLDDRSAGAAASNEFLARRLAEAKALPRLNPFRFLRPASRAG